MGDHEAPSPSGVNLSNSAYNVLRRLVEVVFPALAGLYTALAILWGWGYVEEVVGTITAVTIFCAAVLGLSRKAYKQGGQYDGELILDETTNPEQPTVRFALNPAKAQQAFTKDVITFKGLPNS